MRPLAQLQAVPLPEWTADELAALRRACAPPSLELCDDDERERIRYELGEFAGDGFRPGRAVDPSRMRLRDPIRFKADRPHAGDVVHFPEGGGHYSASGYGIVGGGSLPYVTLNCAPPFREAGPGYQVTQEEQTVTLLTYWQVTHKPDRPFSLMGHLIGTDGLPVAVGDGLGVPWDQLQPRDILIQRHALPIPAELPSGDYRLQTGAYWLDTMERWPIIVDDQIVGDRLPLTTFSP